MAVLSPWAEQESFSGVSFHNLSLLPLSDLEQGLRSRWGRRGVGAWSTCIEKIKKVCRLHITFLVLFAMHHFRFLLSRFGFVWGGGLASCSGIGCDFTGLNDVIDIEY